METLFTSLRLDYMMIFLVVYLLFKMFPKRHEGVKQRIYCWLLFIGLLQAVSSFIILMEQEGVITLSSTAFYTLLALYFMGICLVTFGWFCYSEIVMETGWLNHPHRKVMLSLPLLVYFLLCVTSYRTHLMFYVDDAGVYHRGTIGFMQFLLPGLYLMGLLIRICQWLRTSSRSDAFMRGVLFYPLIHAVCIFFQIRFGFAHIIFASVSSLLVAYIELHSIEGYKLEQAKTRASELRKQFHIIEALSSDVADIFVLDVKRGLSSLFKLHGKVVSKEERRNRSYAEAFEHYIQTYVHPEDRDYVRSQYPISVVTEQLSHSAIYTFSYRVIYQGELHHYQVRFSRVEVEDGEEDLIFFGYLCIDNIVKLRVNSYHDSLTGLYNRHAYEEKIEEYEKKQGPAPDFVVVSFDVNGLKVVNDTLGHQGGDELLIGAAQCMKDSFGTYGNVYRVGGDEFVAFVNADDALLQHLLANLQSRVDQWHGKLVKSLSVAVGYVPLREQPTCTVQELIHLSDVRMYSAKAAYYEQKKTHEL